MFIGIKSYSFSIKGTKYLLLNVEKILFHEMSFTATGRILAPSKNGG
jgi:hypothetical protein